MIEAVRISIRGVMRHVAGALHNLSRGRLTPNAVTIFGAVMHAPIALLIALGQYRWAAVFLVIFGLLDTLDGQLAQVQRRESALGTLLDSATDRMKEVALYTGAAYSIIATTGRPYLAVWAVAACGASLLTSYVNAWGDAVMARFHIAKHAVNKGFRGGLLPFELRMVVLLLGLLSGRLTLAIMVIALGAGYTALSRLVRVASRLKEADV
ncbi:MAG TPA: CDP-alcohol phosphatidyltransferase family protein [Candidatus Saccharimonadales bacterium]|nr:CDP-alcohol phosphatidyltransferase family protein [Candidatus Saccharimonadales bacterium]